MRTERFLPVVKAIRAFTNKLCVRTFVVKLILIKDALCHLESTLLTSRAARTGSSRETRCAGRYGPLARRRQEETADAACPARSWCLLVHSINSSARTRLDGGIGRPRGRAGIAQSEGTHENPEHGQWDRKGFARGWGQAKRASASGRTFCKREIGVLSGWRPN